MVKTVKKSLALAAILAVGGGLLGKTAFAEESVDVPVEVELTKSYTVDVTDLNFGEILATSDGGSIRIDASAYNNTSTTTLTEADRLLPVASSGLAHGEIEVTTIPCVMTADYPADGVVVLTGQAGDAPYLDNIDGSSTAIVDLSSETDVTAGVFYIGAELVLPQQSDPTLEWDGVWTGTIPVTINFE